MIMHGGIAHLLLKLGPTTHLADSSGLIYYRLLDGQMGHGHGLIGLRREVCNFFFLLRLVTRGLFISLEHWLFSYFLNKCSRQTCKFSDRTFVGSFHLLSLLFELLTHGYMTLQGNI